MRVTVCELPPDHEAAPDPAICWDRLVEHVRAAGSDLVLLPEMPFAPWLAASDRPDAVRWQEAVDSHERWWPRLGELAPAAVLSTRPVLDQGRRRNRAFAYERGVARDLHDKTFLPDEPGYFEATWYERGDRDFGPHEVAGLQVGILVCTEIWFLEHARALGKAGIQLLAVPRATPRDTTERWIAAGRVAAVVAGAYCVSSNLCEPPGASSADLGGRSWVIDPEGEVLALTSEATPFVTVEIDPAVADAAKSGYPRYVLD